MIPFMQRAVWLHIDLPGQGDGEEELPATYVFPPISKLPEAMKEVLDHFKIKQLVLFGEGAGANILARFAFCNGIDVCNGIVYRRLTSVNFTRLLSFS
ncbi:protein NDRG1 [Clonorchis sinensis]|uniref:Protein NDRG1 n=1 Tax=Clonorchis sinensis TaxID=79923 RepID=G7YVN6_CLOSI|nr:protein NDRG1 [Clonorchis sinensis]